MKNLLLAFLFFCFSFLSYAQMYFPPNSGTTWQTIDPTTLGWCQTKIDALYTYLENSDSKAFMILKDGKIVLEKYFGTFTADSFHVWNSAGKTLTAFTVGIAQQENHLKITDTTSKIIGYGWTSLSAAQEEKITVKNQLSMTTGLDDGVADIYCTLPSCLQYKATPGTRWAYHNGPYTLLDSVIQISTGQTLNTYVNSKVLAPTGMTGLFVKSGYNRVFVSKARTMARFGLLLLNEGIWNGTPILNDPTYFNEMTNSSQNINPSYGYLTWLNGKSSYMLPGSQFSFSGASVPNAPTDMYAALGKNGQIINVIPSQNLVVIRMGSSMGNALVGNFYNDTIWMKINDLNCSASLENIANEKFSIYPNPSKGWFKIKALKTEDQLEIINLLGKNVACIRNENEIYIENKGVYFIKVNGELLRTKLVIE